MMNALFALLMVYLGGSPSYGQTAATQLLSRGPGAQAAGLGGAVVAISQDPASLYWNPAGLANAGGTLMGEHLFLFGGARYDFAGLSIPSRWGAFGLGAMQLGRGGITVRSAVDDPGHQVSATQSDYMLGYARAFGRHWSAGTTINILDFNIAGNDDKGFGVDLGGQGSYLGEDFLDLLPQSLWNFGASIRNALQPSLRLAADQETYPREFRGGIGLSFRTFSREFGLGMIRHDRAGILLSFRKISGEPGMNPAIGLSYSFDDMLDFRAGFNGTISGGLGLHTADSRFVIDYALEDRPLALNHRFTVTFKFIKNEAPGPLPVRQEIDEGYLRAFNRSQAFSNEYFSRGMVLFKDLKYKEAYEALETARLLDPESSEKSAAFKRLLEAWRRDSLRLALNHLDADMVPGREAKAYQDIATLLELGSDDRQRLLEILGRLPTRMTPSEYQKAAQAAFDKLAPRAMAALADGRMEEAKALAGTLELLQSSSTATSTADLKARISARETAAREKWDADVLSRASDPGRALEASWALKKAYPGDPRIPLLAADIKRFYLERAALGVKEKLYLRKLYCLAAVAYAKKEWNDAGNFLDELLRTNPTDDAARDLLGAVSRSALGESQYTQGGSKP